MSLFGRLALADSTAYILLPKARYDYDNPRIVKRRDALDLTQDVSVAVNLQPAFQVGENLMRKADAIFEKEQAYVVESALHKPHKKPELYVNNHG
jgi:mediator of replication checkpoint protein 1